MDLSMQIIVCMTVLFPDVFPLFSCFHAVCFLGKLLVTFERFRIRFRISTDCTKKYIFFFQMFRKDGLSKKIALDYDLSCISGKIFLFPENMILFFRQKMKDDLSQKNTWKCDIYFKCSKKMVFPKKNRFQILLSSEKKGNLIYRIEI